MNIAVGTITNEARTAISDCGGTIEPTLNPEVMMVKVDGVKIIGPDSQHVWILIGDDITLIFTRAWRTEECSLDLCK